jgi:methionyl-tRNA synthetase
MDGLALHEAAASAFEIVDAANEFIAETTPWTLAKAGGDAARLDEVLFEVAEAVRIAAVLLRPIMPTSSAEILRRVGEGTDPDALLLDRDGRWRSDGARHIAKAPSLWPRTDEDTRGTAPAKQPRTDTDRNAPAVGGAAARPSGEKDPTVEEAATVAVGNNRISIDDFMKVELRVAKVLEAEAVPKSKKLLKLKVDTGVDQRTIVAGIAEAYQPDQLIGRTIVIVANLQPAKLMGVESQGMVLAASLDGGPPTLVGFDAPMAPGARVR